MNTKWYKNYAINDREKCNSCNFSRKQENYVGSKLDTSKDEKEIWVDKSNSENFKVARTMSDNT